MPPVVTVFEGEDLDLECKVRYANGTLISPCEQDGLLQSWILVDDSENKIGDEIARCDKVAMFKNNKTVKFNEDNGNLTILNMGLLDEAVVQCVVFGLSGVNKNRTEVRVKKGKCCLFKLR